MMGRITGKPCRCCSTPLPQQPQSPPVARNVNSAAAAPGAACCAATRQEPQPAPSSGV